MTQTELPHGGVRLFHQKSTCLKQLTLGTHVLQIWSRYVQNYEPTRSSYATVRQKRAHLRDSGQCAEKLAAKIVDNRAKSTITLEGPRVEGMGRHHFWRRHHFWVSRHLGAQLWRRSPGGASGKWRHPSLRALQQPRFKLKYSEELSYEYRGLRRS